MIQDFASDREAAGQAAVSTRLHLEEGAKIRLIQIQRLGNGFTFMNDIGALCEEKASLEVIQLILGRKEYLPWMQDYLTGQREQPECRHRLYRGR